MIEEVDLAGQGSGEGESEPNLRWSPRPDLEDVVGDETVETGSLSKGWEREGGAMKSQNRTSR